MVWYGVMVWCGVVWCGVLDWTGLDCGVWVVWGRGVAWDQTKAHFAHGIVSVCIQSHEKIERGYLQKKWAEMRRGRVRGVGVGWGAIG